MFFFRLIALVAVLVVAGGAVGWYVWPGRSDVGVDDAEHAHPLPLAQVQHRFPLLPADLKSDRERPALAVDAQGRVLVAWVSQTSEEEYTLFVVSSLDGGFRFDEPRPFRKIPLTRGHSAKHGAFTSAVLPRLAAHGDTVTLAWLEPTGKDGAVRILTAPSRDGGWTFGNPVCAHGVETERPAFHAVATARDGSVACAWMDRRGGSPQPFASFAPAAALSFQPQSIVYSNPDGKGICPCCDLDVARTADGRTLVAFRDARDGCRDVYVARADDGEPVPVSTDRWELEGCPHDGPALAVAGDRVYVTWMSGHTQQNRVYLASAATSDLKFAPRVLTNVAGNQGHPRLAVGAAGAIHLVWDEASPDVDDAPSAGSAHQHGGSHRTPRQVRYLRSHDGRETFVESEAVSPRPGAVQRRPVVTLDGAGRALVAWNEITDEGKFIAFARLRSAKSPCCATADEAACCTEVPSRRSLLAPQEAVPAK